MIARLWHGWTQGENIDRYEKFVRTEVLASLNGIEGYKGAYLLRADGESETEFVTLTLFEDLAAVRRFAGEDYHRAVVPAEARKFLSRFDERSKHYQIIQTPA